MPDGPETAIQKMMGTRLLSGSLLSAEFIAMPNEKFTPPSAGNKASEWMRVSYLPAETQSPWLTEGDNMHFGIMQVDSFAPLEVGELKPTRLAEKVIQRFRNGTVLFGDGYKTRISATPYRLAMVSDDEWVMVPVRVPYRCFAPTPA